MGVYDYKFTIKDRMAESATMSASESEMQSNDIKTYVRVLASFSPEGSITPVQMTWEDGRKYAIDRIVRIQRAASRKAGGVGIRYACMVCGREVHLYYEGSGRWFVERKVEQMAQ